MDTNNELVEMLDRTEFSAKQVNMLAADIMVGDIPERQYLAIISKYPNTRIAKNALRVLNLVCKKSV